MGAKWLVSLMVVLMVGVYGTQGQDTRVKLCGREFVRMVVSSCGSSRLKRNALEFGQQHRTNPHRAIMDWLNSDQFANLRSPETEGDVLRRRENQNPTERLTNEYQATSGFPSSTPPKVPGEMEPSNASQGYTVSSRTRRDVGLAGVCCRSGCTMNELVQYC